MGDGGGYGGGGYGGWGCGGQRSASYLKGRTGPVSASDRCWNRFKGMIGQTAAKAKAAGWSACGF